MGPLGTTFKEIYIKVQNVSFRLENVVCEMAAIFPEGDELNGLSPECVSLEIECPSCSHHLWMSRDIIINPRATLRQYPFAAL